MSLSPAVNKKQRKERQLACIEKVGIAGNLIWSIVTLLDSEEVKIRCRDLSDKINDLDFAIRKVK